MNIRGDESMRMATVSRRETDQSTHACGAYAPEREHEQLRVGHIVVILEVDHAAQDVQQDPEDLVDGHDEQRVWKEGETKSTVRRGKNELNHSKSPPKWKRGHRQGFRKQQRKKNRAGVSGMNATQHTGSTPACARPALSSFN